MLKFQSEGFQSNVLGTCMTTLVVAHPNALGRMNGLWDTFIHDWTCVKWKGYRIHSFTVEHVSTEGLWDTFIHGWMCVHLKGFRVLRERTCNYMATPNCREFKNANSKQPNLCPKDSNVRLIHTPDPKMTLNDFLWQNLGVIILVLIDWLSHFSVICLLGEDWETLLASVTSACKTLWWINQLLDLHCL
jgi:hypothetical protein